jgi:replicative DNA helicase
MSDKPVPRIGSSTDLKRRTHKVAPSLAYGKVQPQATDVEEVVLGAILLDQDAIFNVVDTLSMDMFYSEGHQAIYRAVLQLFEKSDSIDIITTSDQLRKNGELDKAGGPYKLATLSNRVGSASNIEFHARIIAQKAVAREIIKASSEMLRDAYDETVDVFEHLSHAQQLISDVAERFTGGGTPKFGNLVAKALNSIKLEGSEDDDLEGVPTGFKELDKVTAGWQPTDLIILAARPGMGKTGFILRAGFNAARDHQKTVAVFSLEMTAVQLVQRILSFEASVKVSEMRTSKLHQSKFDRLVSAAERLHDLPMYIDDTPSISITDLRAKCRRLKAAGGLSMVVIDYLQLMTSSNKGSREQEISNISGGLKKLAKELDVPVVALAQLSRAVEQRGGDRRPMLSDLRESGSIEQDADQVMFLYRPEYYDITEDADGNSLKSVAKIIIAKNRHGECQDVRMRFVKTYATFEDWGNPLGKLEPLPFTDDEINF